MSAAPWSTFLAGLQIILIGLRLSGFVHWPWWLVMTPAELALIGLAVLGATIIGMVINDNRVKRNRRT